METEDPKDQTETTGDESPEEFREQVENDPSTAKPSDMDDDNAGHLRGG